MLSRFRPIPGIITELFTASSIFRMHIWFIGPSSDGLSHCLRHAGPGGPVPQEPAVGSFIASLPDSWCIDGILFFAEFAGDQNVALYSRHITAVTFSGIHNLCCCASLPSYEKLVQGRRALTAQNNKILTDLMPSDLYCQKVYYYRCGISRKERMD